MHTLENKEIEIKWYIIQDTRKRTKKSNLQKVGESNKD